MKNPVLLLLCVLSSAVCAQEFDFEDGLDFRSEDGNFRLEFGGRLHLDAAYFDDDNTELNDSSEVRRARLGAALTLFRDFELDYTYEFTGNGRVLDASLTYTGFDPWELRIGQFRESFSLDELTSSNYITFMERALPNEFVRGYNSGIALYTHGENWSAAGGLFGDRIVKDVFGSGDEDRSITGRLTFAPLHEETRVAHFGLSASAREVDDGNRVRFATDPESSIAVENLVSTGPINNVDKFYVGGIEAASVNGPLSLQGEYIFTRLDRENGRSDVDFNGWYVFASWFLTGESRNYRVSRGSFGRVNPKRGTGAFELALRYSTLDLNDGPVTGGRETNTTLGLNWYFRRNFRLMANYIHVVTDDEGGDEDVNILQFRAQAYF